MSNNAKVFQKHMAPFCGTIMVPQNAAHAERGLHDEQAKCSYAEPKL